MNNIAILVGNTEYDSLANLSCCKDDLLAMQELLAATDRFSVIEVIENAHADSIKTTNPFRDKQTPICWRAFLLLYRTWVSAGR